MTSFLCKGFDQKPVNVMKNRLEFNPLQDERSRGGKNALELALANFLTFSFDPFSALL